MLAASPKASKRCCQKLGDTKTPSVVLVYGVAVWVVDYCSEGVTEKGAALTPKNGLSQLPLLTQHSGLFFCPGDAQACALRRVRIAAVTLLALADVYPPRQPLALHRRMNSITPPPATRPLPISPPHILRVRTHSFQRSRFSFLRVRTHSLSQSRFLFRLRL